MALSKVYRPILRYGIRVEGIVECPAVLAPRLCVALYRKLPIEPSSEKVFINNGVALGVEQENAYSSVMTIRGLSDVFAERPSSIAWAASNEFRMIVGCPRMFKYVTSPTSERKDFVSAGGPDDDSATPKTHHICQPCLARTVPIAL